MASRRLPPLPTVNDILRMYSIRAKKKLSQNFLMDPRLLDRVARAGGPLAGCHVVEVGPGPGGITRSILGQEAIRCAVIEKDPRFLPSLELLNEASGNRLDINMGDVLSYNMAKIFPDSLRRDWEEDQDCVRLLGNLPFNVSTPLIIRWLSNMCDHSSLFSYGRVPLTLTFQLEVAQRMIAAPSHSHRSRLSVMCQNWASVRHHFTIPGAAFVPKPEVDVAVVTFTPLITPYIDLPFPLVEKVISTIFHGKKKDLKNTISNLFPQAMSRRFSEQMMYEADLLNRGSKLRAIDLSMASLNALCHSYKRITDENPTILSYNNRAAKSLALGEAKYEDGELYTGEHDMATLTNVLGNHHQRTLQ